MSSLGFRAGVWDFNPRLHAGGDRSPLLPLPCALYFNPRLHAGGDGEAV